MCAATLLMGFLSALAAASPLIQAQRRETPYLASSFISVGTPNTPIYFDTISAANSSFWIGASTRTYCPSSFPENFTNCSAFHNSTSILVYNTSTTASMNSAVPGGQTIYVSPTGALSFTSPNRSIIPAGSYTSGFTIGCEQPYYPPECSPTWNFTGGWATGFYACPLNDPAVYADPYGRDFPYKVFLDVEGWVVPSGNMSDCLPFSVAVSPDMYGDGVAWGAYEYV